MKLVCPSCGFAGDIDAYLADAHARAALVWALQAPAPLGDRLMRYLALFRPAQRALSWDRIEKILGELVEAIQRGHIERHGRHWPAPAEYWSAAIDQMLATRERLQLPLKGHGYLYEIVAGFGNKAESRVEAQREQTRMQRPAPLPSADLPETPRVRTGMPAHVRDTLTTLGALRPQPKGDDDGQS